MAAVAFAGSLVAGPGLGGAEPAGASTTLPTTVEAWVYPGSAGEPTCKASQELAAMAGAPISLIKPEYLTIGSRGRVLTETAAGLPCNGFSPANLALARAAAQRVYVTVSAGTSGVKGALSNPVRTATAEAAITSFVATNNLDGVDLDFEPNRWTASLWLRFVHMVSDLNGKLSSAGRGVEVDLEPFTSTPWDAERYGDIANAGAHVVVMAYDHEFDIACAAITPYSWLTQVVTYAQSQVAPSQLTIGLPAYGYHTANCSRVSHVVSNVALVTMEGEPGFPSTPAAVAGLRDPGSGEVRWSWGGTFYDYVDSTSLDAKLQLVESMGVADVSVWSLGGEPWFSGYPG
ncbi:MAG TPA: glycoside hydrolase family 18 protein [Acidimicrobiales bacterium]|nr:glycoside hydrolase family 18 protein [Acidimicrobiales bacterium]